MIPFDFEYYRPKTIEEAVKLFIQLNNEHKNPMYISGGTELITLGRMNELYTKAVIDMKGIPECNELDLENERLIIGSCCTLTTIEEKNLFPLLTNTSREVADHTARNKITIGGNICGNIFYREAVLPFLLAESNVVIDGPSGTREVPINNVFNKKLILQQGEFLVQIVTNINYLNAPNKVIKRRRQWTTGYPLVTVAGLMMNKEIRLGISGLCPFPFRNRRLEEFVNNAEISRVDEFNEVINELPQPVLSDTEGSAAFRLFVLKNSLLDVIKALKGD